MPCSLAPVDPEVLDEERGGDHPGPVVHPAFLAQLPHAGVDERVAGHPFLPGREPVGVVEPAVTARPQVLDLRSRLRVEDLRVEVPPAELAHERLAAALLRTHGERARRDAAEVQVGREPRGRVGGDRVVAAGAVAVEVRAQPGAGSLDARALAASAPVPSSLGARHRARLDAGRQANRRSASARASPAAPATRRGGRARRPGSGRCPSG